MKNEFLKHLFVEGTKRWGGFMSLSGHLSITQTNWHWILETLLVIFLDSILILGLYVEWKSKRKKD